MPHLVFCRAYAHRAYGRPKLTMVLALSLLLIAGAAYCQGASRGPSRSNGTADTASTAAGSPGAEPTVDITVGDSGVSVYAVSADAHLVLTRLAEETGLRLIVDDSVDRSITVNLANKQPREIIDLIVDAYGFSFSEVEGIYIISEGIPKGPSSYLLTSIDTITTKYVQAGGAKALLPYFLQEHVKVSADQNAVVLSGPEPVLRKFRKDIEQFDVPAEQIMLDALVVEFTDLNTDTFSSEFGWQNASLGLVGDSLSGDMSFTAIVDLPTDFYVRLRALISSHQARVRANPRIATVSGRSASIFIGQQQYLRVPVNINNRSSNSIDAGVSLTMTPLTGGQGDIILDLSEEISTLSAPDAVTGLPEKTTRSASTTVRIQNGNTIIIGGLSQEELREKRSRIPILSEIPLIGQLFRSKRLEKTVVDLAIFITAQILTRTGHLPAAEEQQTIQQFVGDGAK